MAEVEPPKDASTQCEWLGSVFPAFRDKGKLTDIGRGVVYGFRSNGWSQNACARMFNISAATVRTTVAKVEAELRAGEAALETVPRQPREGTPEPTFPEEPPTVAKRRDAVLEIAEDLAQAERSAQKLCELIKEKTGRRGARRPCCATCAPAACRSRQGP